MSALATTAAAPRPRIAANRPLRWWRRNTWWVLSIASLSGAIALVLAIFLHVFALGIPALRPSVFTTVTNGVSGGLANALAGTFLLTTCGVLLVVFLGFGTAIYVAEYAQPRVAAAVRFINDVLAGVPSIVVGYFGYVVLVIGLGWQFSLAAGAIALAIIMLPYVMRGADLALSDVPRELREGALALGATSETALRTVALPYALPGMLTALLLAIGIALGETAPLLYTAGWSNYLPSLAPTHAPVAFLTYVVWTFINEPFPQAHALAYAAATILIVLILVTNVVARIAIDSIVRRSRGS
ncbi:MAG: phosphate ABC transporter permease PstA [Vulcanimicrobiaceae bacterium]